MDILITVNLKREAEEMDRLVISVATGTGIAWGGKPAYEAWLSSRSKPASERPADPILARDMALAQLASQYPGRVKIAKVN